MASRSPFQTELFSGSVFLLPAHCKDITMQSHVHGFPHAHVSQCFEFQNYMQHQFPGEAVHLSWSTPELLHPEQHGTDANCHLLLLPPAGRAAAIPHFTTKSLRFHTKHKLINQTTPVVTWFGGHWVSAHFPMDSQFWERISRVPVLHEAKWSPGQTISSDRLSYKKHNTNTRPKTVEEAAQLCFHGAESANALRTVNLPKEMTAHHKEVELSCACCSLTFAGFATPVAVAGWKRSNLV